MSEAAPGGGILALALSEKCVALLLERGTVSGVGTGELAHAAGISLRTFHRYLGSKEDCVRPVLAAAVSAMGRALVERPLAEPLNAALAEAFAASASGRHLDRTLRLIPLLTETPAMRAVWAQSLHDARRRSRRSSPSVWTWAAPPSRERRCWPRWCSRSCAERSSTRPPRASIRRRCSLSTWRRSTADHSPPPRLTPRVTLASLCSSE
ncbi:TetR/AcrR family transcriptional regulator [Rathayibacter tanaceti]|uniref:HTH tetR-type domain-containing protein n=1 Tax=Rathayibacter tanaceti TaxID=1671680 RepID=A0A162GKL5_9MICO|nr:TetR/AcrR family transcriptional regulator [Rathayibacter tanaceti]KZX22759.1 hypothetical protein ACH61_00113 [Rathayibacter tanaceti]